MRRRQDGGGRGDERDSKWVRENGCREGNKKVAMTVVERQAQVQVPEQTEEEKIMDR